LPTLVHAGAIRGILPCSSHGLACGFCGKWRYAGAVHPTQLSDVSSSSFFTAGSTRRRPREMSPRG
jgi:hypothetical protein